MKVTPEMVRYARQHGLSPMDIAVYCHNTSRAVPWRSVTESLQRLSEWAYPDDKMEE